MSLQWTAVATFLYAEVFLVLLLCVPFVSAARWQKIFKSRLVSLAVAYGNTVFVVLIVILVLLLFGGWVGGARRGLGGLRSLTHPASCSLLRRLVTLISQQAVLGASSEAFRKQAEGASQAARRYMEDNDALRKVAWLAVGLGGEGAPPGTS
ncbi:BAP31 protein, partial [Glaucidium brasilianum]|nr:BAP31 protein [Glaucidium brasilianum]